MKSEGCVFMEYYLFPKYFNHLKIEELMELCAEYEINGPTALIRDGYWLSLDNFMHELPNYIKAAEKYKLKVKYAEVPYSMLHLIENPDILTILSENGIRFVRVGYVKRNTTDARNLYEFTRSLTEKITDVAEKSNIKVIIQLHGGCYPHNATSAYPLVKGLDPNFIGIKIDPGNNYNQEGYEDFAYQISLLNEYIGALGAKDACSLRITKSEQDDKGWKTFFVPAFEGQSNYNKIFTELKKIGYNGPIILMPFYDTDNFNLLLAKFKKEVNYFKNIEKLTSITNEDKT